MNGKAVDVLVVGGGIVGVCIARELQESGADVLLIDKSGVGKGCSYANAGWVTPCFAMPLAQPGMILKATRWLMDSQSPFYIKPTPSLSLIRWLLRFLVAANQRKMLRSVAALTEISKYSLNFYRSLAESAKKEFSFEPRGLLLVSGEKSGLRMAKLEMELMAQRGIPGQFMDQEELLSFEPALKPIVKGGVFFPEEAQVEPYQTVRAVYDQYRELGGKEVLEAEVIDFQVSGREIIEVNTTHGRFRPKVVVLAAGTWTKRLAELLGCKIPVLGGKGYSMNVAGDFVKPKRPIMIVERKIAVTPRAHSLRLAGTLELVDQDFEFSPNRVKAIHQGAREYLHLEQASEPTEIWRGLRPCTPDGVPLIGFSRRISNLFYCVGHQLLGLQSAPGSAKLAADLIAQRTPMFDPKPFRPERYES